MQPSRKLWYSREDKNIAMKKLKKSECRTLRRSADRKMVCTACLVLGGTIHAENRAFNEKLRREKGGR